MQLIGNTKELRTLTEAWERLKQERIRLSEVQHMHYIERRPFCSGAWMLCEQLCILSLIYTHNALWLRVYICWRTTSQYPRKRGPTIWKRGCKKVDVCRFLNHTLFDLFHESSFELKHTKKLISWVRCVLLGRRTNRTGTPAPEFGTNWMNFSIKWNYTNTVFIRDF